MYARIAKTNGVKFDVLDIEPALNEKSDATQMPQKSYSIISDLKVTKNVCNLAIIAYLF